MIDISAEELIPIRDVPKRLPQRPNGKAVHVSAVYRWVQRGVRGHRLEAIRIGGTSYTSLEALQRFADQNQASTGSPPVSRPPTVTRQKQIDRAAREVARILGTGANRTRR